MNAHRDSELEKRPVFVDASGRRGRTFRRFGWAVAVVCACYATTVAASLIGGSSSAPFLQIPGVADEVAEAAEVTGEETGAGQPSWEPTIPNGTLPSGWGWEEGVVPPSATAAPAEAADATDGDGAAAPRETPAGGAGTIASGAGPGQNNAGTGPGADTAPTPPASVVTPPADDNTGAPPEEPRDEPDPSPAEPEGNGNPVDGLLGGLLGLPPLLGG
ncbi:hypothetical protein P3L51_05375 [Streptomyces sp. PSRA5]|uniref:hypothetical protein n=1 Tax=Streptomyces panacea TaxID=3035064 RepID=UPI00339D2900